jgi:hypothetical protein
VRGTQAPDAAIAERVRRVQLPFNPQAEAAKVATAEDLARRAQLKVHTRLEAPDLCARNPEAWYCAALSGGM